MKNQFVCILYLAVAFVSCDKRDDLIRLENNAHVLLRTADADGNELTVFRHLGQDTCLDITVISWLAGAGVLHPILEMAKQEAGHFPSKQFNVVASGDAMSETLARGFSALNMIYHNKPHRITGGLVTRFYYGEVLELKFEGISLLQYEGQILHVEVDVKEAILRTGTEVYLLDEGVVRFSIPRQPEGPLSLDVELHIKICLQ